MLKVLQILFFSLLICSNGFALDPEDDAVFVRVLDVGGGLACVIRIPGDHYIVYDAGNWETEEYVLNNIKEIIPEGEKIDLLVISHGDADHIGAVKDILELYTVQYVLRTGLKRDTRSWQSSNNAITSAQESVGTIDVDLKNVDFPPGSLYKLGDAFIIMLSGFYWPPSDWDLRNNSERRNAGSIVIKLLFKDRSILFAGDAVGRNPGDPHSSIKATELFMVNHRDKRPLNSDVLIAPHNGSDGSSSAEFIKEVNPTWVIFSAGHKHRHPRSSTANRYLNNGVEIDKIFRTDLGDDEGSNEWDHGRIAGQTDKPGDDDIDVLIRPNGELIVEYRNK